MESNGCMSAPLRGIVIQRSRGAQVSSRVILRYSPALPLDQGLCVVNPVVRHGEHGKGEDRQGDEESSELHVRRWGKRVLRWLMSGMLRGGDLYNWSGYELRRMMKG
jgi:hypothetical protein